MPPKTPEMPVDRPVDPQENKGLVNKLKAMLSGGNPDANDPAKQAELAAARQANAAVQQQRAAERTQLMQNKIQTGEVPVVSAHEAQTGQSPAASPEAPQNPEDAPR